jgi:hypothetical protein
MQGVRVGRLASDGTLRPGIYHDPEGRRWRVERVTECSAYAVEMVDGTVERTFPRPDGTLKTVRFRAQGERGHMTPRPVGWEREEG